MVTKPVLAPGKPPVVPGKFCEVVFPATYALPALSIAMPYA